jgi:anti-anti-sigma factor
MNTKVKKTENYTLMDIEGRLDTVTAAAFEASVLEVLEKEARLLILRCSDLEYISSSGLRVFLLAQKKMMAAGGKLQLCCLRPNIFEVFEISGFTGIFQILPDDAGL